MRIRAAIAMLLLLILVHNTRVHTGIYFAQEHMIVSPILSFEIVTKSPRIYASVHESDSTVTISILRRSWNYDRKEKHPI